jgi:Leucine-rich repeat (LRR) protein
LEYLSLNGTLVTDVTPLANLTRLQTLALNDTKVHDLTPLGRLAALQSLFVINTRVDDLSPIAGLVALKTLSLNGTPVRDLNPLAHLIALERLRLNGTRVTRLAPIAALKALQTLSINGAPVGDLSSIAVMTWLQDTVVKNRSLAVYGLKYANTPISRIAPFNRYERLKEPAATVETINEIRRQQGLPEYLPDGYEQQAELPLDVGIKNLPSIPNIAPAAIEPIFIQGCISLLVTPQSPILRKRQLWALS